MSRESLTSTNIAYLNFHRKHINNLGIRKLVALVTSLTPIIITNN